MTTKKPSYEELEQRIAFLEKESVQRGRFAKINTALFKISTAVNTSSTLDELFKTIHATLSPVIDTTNFYIALYDKPRDRVTFPYVVDTVDKNYPPVVEISKTASLTAEVIRTGVPVMVTKADILTQRAESGLKIPGCTPAEIWLGVPLKTEGEIIGVMAVQNYHDPFCYDETDMNVMVSVADQVAIALDRKQSEEHLQQFQDIVSSTQDGIAFLDTNYRYIIINSAYEKFSGIKKENFIGLTVADYFGEDIFNQTIKPRLKKCLQGNVINYQEWFDYPAIGRRCVDITYFPYLNKNNQIAGIVANTRDITEQRQAQEALASSERKYRELFEANQDAITIFRIGSDGIAGKFLDMNQAALTLAGYSKKEFINLKPSDFEKEASQETLDNRLAEIKIKGHSHFETVLFDKSRNEIPVEIHVREILYEGRPAMMNIARDIRDRKHVEIALSESEEKWRNILVNTPQIGVALDPQATIIFANTHFLKLTGWQESAVIGQNWFDLFIPEQQRARVRDAFNSAIRSDSSSGFSTYENEICTRTGENFDISWSNVITKDSQGDVIDVTCLGVDLTERKRAEDALRASEERFRFLLDGVPMVSVQGYAADGTTLYWNEGSRILYGYTAEEALGKNLLDLIIPPNHREGVARCMQNMAETGDPLPASELEMMRKDGSTVMVYSSHCILHRPGYPQELYCVDIDLSGIKQAEVERSRLMLAVEQAAEVFVITDSEGVIQYVNPAFEKVTGYSREEAIGQKPRILKSGEHDETFYRRMWTTLTSGKTWRGQIINKRKNGEHFIENAVISPVRDSSGNLINYAAVKYDVTEQLQTSKMLQQAQKMESVGRLAGGVAHDFNNMLGVILGHAELAMEQLNPAQPIFADLQQIQQAANRSADITRQLLAFARKQIVAPKVIDLNETVAGMLKMLLRLIGEDINLAWLPQKGLWPINVDPSQIDQILANLCVNARDAIAGVGKITVETGNCTLDKEYCTAHTGFISGEYVRLGVSDNGSGIDKEILSHIFEPFFTTKSDNKGTGLGLATVYGIVKQNSGFVNVYSEQGQGTTFTIYLPRYVGTPSQEQREATAEPAVRGNETVLLVEDELTILHMTTTMLQRLGYTVLTADTPGKAIRLAKEHAEEIHLLLTDVIMPEMNGKVLEENLRINRPDLKCLYMSGYTANVISHHGVLDIGVHFIQKPFTKKELAAKVRQVLGDE